MLTLHVATTSFVANAVGNHRGRTISPSMNEAAAKAAWLAKMEGPQWGPEATRDSAPAAAAPVAAPASAPAMSEAAAKAAWLARLDTPSWGGARAVGGLVNDFTCQWLSDSEKAALKATADAMSAPNKGFLASDESAGPWLRAGHVDAAKVPDTEENRAAYRSMLYQAPGLSEYISGVILHVETLYQTDASGRKMVDLINENGMIPGIKLDKGYDTSGIPNTAVGPLGHPETFDKGIDDLDARCKAAYEQGARFAKWRNVLQIDPEKGLPSDLAITLCVHNLAQYATICQRNGLVPIVEPEIVPNGNHGIEVCAAVTEKVLVAQFAALKQHGVYLEGAVLKPNMVKNGLAGPKATPEQIATASVTVLKRTVPVAMPGIFFLSGETALDEDNEEEATNNLNAMNKLYPDLPW
jgi:fructose-bisphosphate aldolase, class I